MHVADLSCHKVMLGPFFQTFLSSNSYPTAPINRSIIFTPSIRFPHARRAIRAGTGSSLAAAATVAHFSDDRGRIQARMVNGTPEISLSRAGARAFCYLPFKYLVFGFLARLYASLYASPSAAVFYSACRRSCRSVDRP